MTDSAKLALMVVGGTAVVGGGWAAFRLYVRMEVQRVLNDEYDYDNYLKKNWLTSRLGSALDIPTARELAESVVPIWSTIMPEPAINDILNKGRSSIYWPPNRRSSELPADVDQAIFDYLRNVRDYYAAQEAQAGQIAQK